MYDRRKFISFLGKAGLGAATLPPFLTSCGSTTTPSEIFENVGDEALRKLKDLVLENMEASDRDDLLLVNGLDYHTVIRWGERISDNDTFGFNNDFNCFIPLDENDPTDGLLWVNHEYINPLFVLDLEGWRYGKPHPNRTVEQVDKEMYNVGGSIVRIKQVDGKWSAVMNDPHNRRLTAQTPIELNWDQPIKGASTVRGTNSNCSGGITPWNTFLTCEENYHDCYGETVYDQENNPSKVPSVYGWDAFYDYPPEHYGWVVEVNPKDGTAKKHVALGRFAHECCTVYELEDKRVVAYSGDDKNDEHLYKFVSSQPGSLKEGTLFVAADTDNGKWLSLDWESQPVLKEKFKDQTEVLIRVREAAKLLGATELN